MGCNYDITKVNKLFNLAVQYYPKKKLAHALRVAEYATAKADLLKLDTTKNIHKPNNTKRTYCFKFDNAKIGITETKKYPALFVMSTARV